MTSKYVNLLGVTYSLSVLSLSINLSEIIDRLNEKFGTYIQCFIYFATS